MKLALIAFTALLSIAPAYATPKVIDAPSIATAPTPLSEYEYRSRASKLTKSAFLLSSQIVLESSHYRTNLGLWSLIAKDQTLAKSAEYADFDPAGASMRQLHRSLLDDLFALERTNAQLMALPVPTSLSRIGGSLERFHRLLPASLRSLRRGMSTRAPEMMGAGQEELQSASTELYAAYTDLVRRGLLLDKNASVPV